MSQIWLMNPTQAVVADPAEAVPEVLSEAAAEAAWEAHPAAWGDAAGFKGASEEALEAPGDRGAGPEEVDQVGRIPWRTSGG